MTIPPLSGQFLTIANTFFNNMLVEQKLWNAFVETYGYSISNPPSPSNPTDMTRYLNYLQGYYSQSQVQTLSPFEVTKRDIVNATLQLVLSLIAQLQKSALEQGTQIQFLANYQQAYTNMIADVPLYVGVPGELTTVDLNDPKKFHFAYGNITAEDVSNFVYNQAVTGLTGDVYSVGSANPPTIPPARSFTFTVFSPTSIGITYNKTDFGPVNTAVSAVVTIPPNTTFANASILISQQFLSMWGTAQANGDFNYPIQNFPVNFYQPGIRWFNASIFNGGNPTSGDPPVSTATNFTDDNAKFGAAQQSRSELNQRNQQFIQNLTAQRQVLSDTSSTMQTNLSNTQTSLSNQINDYGAILDSLRGIIASMFK